MKTIAQLSKSKYTPYFALAIIILSGCWSIYDFTQRQPTLILCSIALLPFSAIINRDEKSARYLIFVIALFVLNIFIHAFSVQMLLLWFSCLLIVELHLGKTSYTTLFLPFLYLSISKSIINIFGYPIRVFLTEVAGKVFSLFGKGIALEGSKIIYNQDSFFVDTACAGIMLFSTSFILFYLMIGIREKKIGRQFNLIQVIMLSVFNLAFLLLANLTRIIALIVLRYEEGHFMHDGIGLFTLILFNLVPAYLILQRINPVTKPARTKSVNHSILLLMAIVIICPISQLFAINTFPYSEELNLNPSITAIATSHTDGVQEIRNGKSVVYIKPQIPLKIVNHNPLVCWQASGFHITNEHFMDFDGKQIFTAILQKGNTTLQTAWWYENESNIYNSEWHWRRDALLSGKNTVLVNVSTEIQEDFPFLINKYLGKIWFK